MKWKFCEFCYINGHCENQDRGHKCECYGKKLEDKCERLEKQLKIAAQALDEVAIYMTCDEVEIREINPDFCADQAALDAVNEAKAKIKELEK